MNDFTEKIEDLFFYKFLNNHCCVKQKQFFFFIISYSASFEKQTKDSS